MEEDLRVLPGTLLAAWPDLSDPNFRHAVILVCHHTADGAYGLIVNRASTLTTRQLLPQHPDLGQVPFPVHVGGPVDKRALQFLHTAPEEIGGGISLDGKLWLGGELDALGRFLARDPDKARERVRVFLGYSGWGGGQLERELAGHSWIPAPPSLEAVFGPTGEDVWRSAVRSIGPQGEALLGQGSEPDLN
jgi:putative transcriptional regulator